ncbi:MAG TPA: hypothetical protein DCR24_04575 [Bacillus bacterium]|nr:hypothetical protein [Bacillus sp. (in: firmicutes)]
MGDFVILRILDFFSPVFEKFGFDYQTLRKILQIKLVMDQRRKPTVFQQTAKKKDKPEDKNAFFRSLWMYAFFGLMLIPFLFLRDNYMVQASIMFSIFMFIVMTTLISDFSSVLLDLRDKSILVAKPIHSRTISMAKLLHVSIYMLYITLAITLIPLIVSLFTQGIFFTLLMIGSLVLLDIFIIALTAMLYLFILRYFDGEKLKDIINYVQIALSVAIMIGYQVVARSFEFVNLKYQIDFAWWQLFLSPMWYGGLFELLMADKYKIGHILLAVLAILGPVVSIILYLKLIPEFESNLQKLSSQTSMKKSRRPSRLFSAMPFLISKEEMPFFRFAGIMMKNERDFKLKVYPSLGFALVVPFVFLFNSYSVSSFEEMTAGRSYLTIYSSLMVIPAAVVMLAHSGSYKGAWIYQAAPVISHSTLNKATLKAFIIRLFLPLYSFLTVIFLMIFGMGIINDLVAILFASFSYTVVCYRFGNNELAFSQPFIAAQESGNIKLFMLLLMIPVFAGFHYLVFDIPFGVTGYTILLFISNWFMWKKIG